MTALEYARIVTIDDWETVLLCLQSEDGAPGRMFSGHGMEWAEWFTHTTPDIAECEELQKLEKTFLKSQNRRKLKR